MLSRARAVPCSTWLIGKNALTTAGYVLTLNVSDPQKIRICRAWFTCNIPIYNNRNQPIILNFLHAWIARHKRNISGSQPEMQRNSWAILEVEQCITKQLQTDTYTLNSSSIWICGCCMETRRTVQRLFSWDNVSALPPHNTASATVCKIFFLDLPPLLLETVLPINGPTREHTSKMPCYR